MPIGRSLDVGVVGLGTAGAAAALLLSRAGHRVTLYERVDSPGPVGAGIVLQPTGAFVLERLGLLARVRAASAPIESLLCVTPPGQPVVDLRYDQLGPNLFGMGTHRGALFAALVEAIRTERIDVRTGVEIVRREPASDGTRLVDASGQVHGPHELVVVADGARSRLREGLPGQEVREYPWGALWFVARDPDHLFERRLYQVVRSTKTLFGLLPTGHGPANDGPWVSLFWSLRADRVAAWRKQGLGAWKEDMAKLVPSCAPLLEQIREPEQVLFSAYHDARLPSFRHRGTVFLGDAAHAMSPQLGQGCNMALIDAWVLAESIAGTHSVFEALTEYDLRRRQHVQHYQRLTRWLTPLFQSDHAALGWLRDRGMGMLRHIDFFKRQMTLGMMGVQQGLLAPPLPLEPFRRALETCAPSGRSSPLPREVDGASHAFVFGIG